MENIQALLESSKYTPLSASDSAAMKLMLENTEKEQDKLINEGTLSGDVAQFTPILMPMVRRVYPNLIANEILGVQPMSMPTGFIYALTNQYSGTQDNKVSPLAIPGVAPINGVLQGQIVVIPNGGVTLGLAVGGFVGVSSTTGASNTSAILYIEEDLVAQTTKILVSGTAIGTGVQVYDNTATPVAVGTGVNDGVYTNEASFGRILKNYTGPVATAIAEALGTNMKEVGFSISKKSVEAKSRALKGQYTVEMYQDLKAQHGLLADEEIMSLMSYEMQAEIDRECVDFVNRNATLLANSRAFTTASDAQGRWEIEKFRVEAIRLSKEAAQIGIDTKRGQGNTLLVSPKVATMLEQVGSFITASSNSTVKQPISGGVAGTFDGRFKVIVDQYATSDYVTVLYKGADRRDAMGFFAPYVPMSFTKVTHPDSGQPAVIAKTRYALDTIPGVSSATSNDRAKTYARTFGISFTNTVLA